MEAGKLTTFAYLNMLLLYISIYVNIHVYLWMHYISLHPLQSGCYAEIPTNRQNDWPLCFQTRERKLSDERATVSHCVSFPSVTVTISTTLDLYSVWDWTLSRGVSFLHEATAHIFYLYHQDGWTWLPTWLHCALTRSQVVLRTVQWGVLLGLFEVGTHPKARPHHLVATHIKGHRKTFRFLPACPPSHQQVHSLCS